jgi:hypothetical protein
MFSLHPARAQLGPSPTKTPGPETLAWTQTSPCACLLRWVFIMSVVRSTAAASSSPRAPLGCRLRSRCGVTIGSHPPTASILLGLHAWERPGENGKRIWWRVAGGGGAGRGWRGWVVVKLISEYGRVASSPPPLHPYARPTMELGSAIDRSVCLHLTVQITIDYPVWLSPPWASAAACWALPWDATPTWENKLYEEAKVIFYPAHSNVNRTCQFNTQVHCSNWCALFYKSVSPAVKTMLW